MKIVTVVGARPQFIKAAAGSRQIRKEHKEILVHTGQHFDDNMSAVFFREMQIPEPDYNLGISGGSHAQMTAKMLIGIEDILLKENPDTLLVYGDTNSTLAAALAAVKLHVPVLHVDAFTTVKLGKYLFNTLLFTLVTTAIMLVVITLAAFAFARLNFRGKNLAFTLFLSLMMIPNELVVITNFTSITNLGLRNTFTGLILPSVTSVFYIYLLRENFAQIPDELYYAAKVDGTSDLRYLRRVMIPICKPTLITIIILKVIECWNSYVWPRIITDDPDYYLVSNGIQEIRENGFGRENIPAMMAAVVVVSLPLIVLFLIFRRKVMAGVARGGTKG